MRHYTGKSKRRKRQGVDDGPATRIPPVWHKYRAKPTEVDGVRFASKAEARRYCELKLLVQAGEIRNLELQPAFPIVIEGVRVTTYIADFAYFGGGKRVIEDVKGFKTDVYALKKKLVEAMYPGVKIIEITSKSKTPIDPSGRLL